LQEFWKKAMTDVYNTVGLTVHADDDPLRKMLRYLIAPWACQFGVEQCLKEAEKNVADYNIDQSR